MIFAKTCAVYVTQRSVKYIFILRNKESAQHSYRWNTVCERQTLFKHNCVVRVIFTNKFLLGVNGTGWFYHHNHYRLPLFVPFKSINERWIQHEIKQNYKQFTQTCSGAANPREATTNIENVEISPFDYEYVLQRLKKEKEEEDKKN